MKKPKDRGTPIDTKRITHWIATFPGYRVAVTEQRIGAWFSQFNAADRDIAARILDSVDFVTSEDIEQAFRKISKELNGWDIEEAKRKGKWRFVAFSRSEGESGATMLHMWRTANAMTSTKYNRICVHRSDLLREDLGPEDTVVFLDDFAGTGKQVSDGWRETMEELLPGQPTIYLILVATTKEAVERIEKETPIQVISHLELEDEDNIFSRACRHFTNQEKITILYYCRRANAQKPMGFGSCGLLIVLAHKTPNNSIPLLHANHNRWVGLFPRQ